MSINVVIACFIAGMCKPYERSLLSLSKYSSMLRSHFTRIIALDASPCSESHAETGTNKHSYYQIQSKLKSSIQGTVVLFIIALLKLIISNYYYNIKKINHWNDPAWYLWGIYLCIFSSGIGILFEYIIWTSSSAKTYGYSCQVWKGFWLVLCRWPLKISIHFFSS